MSEYNKLMVAPGGVKIRYSAFKSASERDRLDKAINVDLTYAVTRLPGGRLDDRLLRR